MSCKFTRNNALTPIGAAILCLLSNGVAYAQGSEQPTAEMVVTGSQIRGIKPIGAPVVSVGRTDIEISGASTNAQLIQQLPQVFNLGVSENSRGQSGGSGNITYGSGINLRGIGPFSTLVLVNGHRVVGQGTTGAAVDPSILPSLAIERVEVVADGASALYGSDAIAGVVNLIMRKNETGNEAFLKYGAANNYSEKQAGAFLGRKWEGGNATFTFENTTRSALSGKDRSFFTGNLLSQGGGDFRSTQCAPGNIVISGANYPIPAGGVTAANAASLLVGTANKCDNLKVQDLIPRQERDSFAMTLNHAINSDINFFADAIASRRAYEFRPGALASNVTVPQTNPFYVRPKGAPAGTNETVAYSFINDLPLNTATGSSKTMEATLGFDFKLNNSWKATALYTDGKNDDISTTWNGLTAAAVNAALADTNPATALNVFGGPNNPATLAKLNANIAISPGVTKFKNSVLKADGPLFELPGGKVRAAVGLEHQNIQSTGGQTTGTLSAPIFGEVTLQRSVNSAYGEVAVPLVSEKNAMAGIRNLSITAAVRKDQYSDVGDTNNPKIGMNWAPVDEFNVRGSYGSSFRAPGLTQIRGFANGGRGGLYVQNYSDPSLNGGLRVGVALSGANPDLKPETAKTKTFGFDWTPAVGKKTKLSVTWFDIVYDNQIVGYLSDLTLLNREAAFAGTNVIQRNPSAAVVSQLIANYPLSAGVLPSAWALFVDGRSYNLSKSYSQGFDLQASTKIPAGELGEFSVSANGTVFTKYTVAATPGSVATDQLNTIFNPLKYKARLNGGWVHGQWQSNVAINYVGSYKNNLANPNQTVAASATVDARVAYLFESGGPSDILKDATFAIGVVNLSNKMPPFVNIAQSPNGGGGFDPTLANPIGRMVSISLNKRF